MTKQVAIQGLKGSFHHEAVSCYFKKEVRLKECKTFIELVKSVVENTVDFGVMAIENSLAGSILQNYGLIRKEEVEVIGEVGLRVKMNLMVLKGSALSDIEEVHSHQMAIRQCGNFFESYPQMKIVETFDTAGSAKYVSENKIHNIAAIASELAATEYNLNIVKKGIEDNNLNYTRFLVIQKKGKSKNQNGNKVSIYFQAKHHIGSLSQILSIISGLGINLGKLQSHPVPSKNSLYGFYATLEIQALDQLEDLIKIMKRMALEFEILGLYKKGKTYG